jgi:hypothetical protein
MNYFKLYENFITEGQHGMAKKLLKSLIAGETSSIEGIKMSKGLAEHYLQWIETSPYGKKNSGLPFEMLVRASFNWGIERGLDSKLKSELNTLKDKIVEAANGDVNESAASDAAEMLMDIAETGWKKFGFTSADDVYDDLAKQKQYADMIDAEIGKAKLAKTIYQNADLVHDQLESDNYHHLNAFLALAGYLGPKHHKSYSNYIKNSKSSSWSPDLFESTLNEAAGASVDTKGDSMPGLSLIQKNVNGVDTSIIEVKTGFYHDSTIADGKKFVQDLQKAFAQAFEELVKKYS